MEDYAVGSWREQLFRGALYGVGGLGFVAGGLAMLVGSITGGQGPEDPEIGALCCVAAGLFCLFVSRGYLLRYPYRARIVGGSLELDMIVGRIMVPLDGIRRLDVVGRLHSEDEDARTFRLVWGGGVVAMPVTEGSALLVKDLIVANPALAPTSK
jgi:hypothetical protein